ncbi:tetratricopeptide repeat protein [uncultured Paraglaciecola sp.]|uniref:tetratricopeptide repeat protein n=1 Tax=uncultured Paraglaciecola sp. TaxID=1765024 RepID=UPI002639C5CE|nr:tetratricopeptide repeat protein [uncultured Paraglaciecola sp.]
MAFLSRIIIPQPIRLSMAVFSLVFSVQAQSAPLEQKELDDLFSSNEPSTRVKTTLTGQVLTESSWPDAYREKINTDLKVAKAAFHAAPDREESYIWLGRRYGYLDRYDEAIKVFTTGLEKFPNSYKLLRFRGRHLARNRDFERAIADYKLGLKKMSGHDDSFEPDGMPNKVNLTISTYRRNLHYYLGQTSFAIGDYRQMYDQLEKSRKPLIALPIDDHEVAVIFWQYIALNKLGKKADANALLEQLNEPVVLLENTSYYEALLILTGRGESQNSRSIGDNLSKFALGMRLQFDGDENAARDILSELVTDSPKGYWPAEVELVNSLDY